MLLWQAMYLQYLYPDLKEQEQTSQLYLRYGIETDFESETAKAYLEGWKMATGMNNLVLMNKVEGKGERIRQLALQVVFETDKFLTNQQT